MEALLAALEVSFLGQLMRTSGVWTYGVVNLFHILSVATLFGAVLLFDLRLLGFWRAVPLGALERPATTLAGLGFAGAVVTGICLLTTNATEYLGNPFLPIKLAAVALGGANVALAPLVPAWRRRHEHPVPADVRKPLAVMGGFSLGCWLAAAAAGRMIGYW